MTPKPRKNYVDSKELEEWWEGWLLTGDQYAWTRMSEMIYDICHGIAVRFNPKGDEYQEHVHDAFIQTLEKIKSGKLQFTRGRAPVFNLITTTIFRILYSKMNRIKKIRENHKKFAYDTIQRLQPEILSTVEYPYDNKLAVNSYHDNE